MKKIVNIVLCLSIVASAVVYAATKIDFNKGGITGQLKTKLAATVIETNGWVVFSNMGEKDSVTIEAIDNSVQAEPRILLDGGKLIKQKGKIFGNINSIVIAAQVPDITNPSNIVTTLAGNDKLSIKLKGINIGTVLAKTMKMVLVNDINGAIAGTNPKGIKIMTQDGDIAGDDATEPALVGAYDYTVGIVETTIPVETKIKSIKAKKGRIGYLDAREATPAKPGKTKWVAKIETGGEVHVKSLADWSTKNKNVKLTELPPE